MPYRERLYSWAIARLQPNFQHSIVGRFRSRSDAEGHYWVLRRLMPETKFAIVFDLEADTALITAVEAQERSQHDSSLTIVNFEPPQ